MKRYSEIILSDDSIKKLLQYLKHNAGESQRKGGNFDSCFVVMLLVCKQ